MAKRGEIIDNKYEILKQIGEGGMSVVYLAMDRRLNKQWAVKEIRKVASNKKNEVVIQSLLAEANLMKRLDHPTLPRIVDIIDDGKTIYVVMDYIEGESLDKILESNGAQPQELVIDWAKQLCKALLYLHSQNPPIIYRDMKPANIMLKPEGTLKVIDFGIAREYKEYNNMDTVSLGTRGYAAPEQFGGMGQTDARTDIYGLGITLYHLVTGQNPSEPPYEIYPIRQWNPSLSSGLEAIIQKCTQLNPADRYQSCDELMYALEHYNQMDDTYRKKQKKKLITFITAAALSVVMLGTGILFRILSVNENKNNYNEKISISTSTSYKEKVTAYTEAISLYPYRTQAYIKLLDAYADNGVFGEEQSKQIMSYYNSAFNLNNRDKYDVHSADFAELNYELGISYFYLYDEENASLKVRALKAEPFFAQIVENAPNTYENYSLAGSYYTVCSFYKEYIANTKNTKEPNKEIYDNLISSLNICVNNLEEYSYDDIMFIRLTIYESITDLLHSQRKSLAIAGADMDVAVNLMENIYTKTEDVIVTQERSTLKRDTILKNKTLYLDDIKNAYESKEK